MKNNKYIDWFQIIGFIISVSLSMYLIRSKQDTITSLLIGLSLAALTQLFDLQIRMGNSTDKVIDSFGNIAAAQILTTKEFGQQLVQSLSGSKHFVLDTVLNRIIHDPYPESYFIGNQGEYRKLLYDKVKKGEITFQRVEVISSKESLETVIFRLLLHEGCRYFIRHYNSPPQPIPIMNLMSFDGEIFYLGGFYHKEAAGEEQTLSIRERHISEFFKNYWNVLWDAAIPLNEGGKLDWEELKRIGKNIGVSEKMFRALVTKLINKVEREKNQSHLK